ncbi:FAD/NAD(P)-binding domain-containing protein, partial [Haematococcus lacustris]
MVRMSYPAFVILQGGERLRHGVCVWSTGNAANPLVQQLVEHVPAQATANAGKPAVGRKLLVDSFLRVVGARDVLALGDCASVCTGPLPATAQ